MTASYSQQTESDSQISSARGERCDSPHLAAAARSTGRAALGLEDDSEEDGLLGSRTGGIHRKVQKQPRSFQTVQVFDMTITAKTRCKGKGIVVPVEGKSFLHILEYLKADFNSNSCITNPQSQPSAVITEDFDRGRVKWIAARSSYVIMYKDALGRSQQTRRGLHVPDRLQGNAFEERRLQILDRARRLWNDEDKTDRPRF